MHAALLAVILLLLAWFVRNDAAEYTAFKALTDTLDRQRVYRRWLLRSFGFFLVGGIVLLLVLGRIDALWRMPPEFGGLAAAIHRRLAEDDAGGGGGHFILFVSGALVAGALLGTLVARHKSRKSSAPVVVGGIEPLLPRNAAERRWTALLAANAGPSEEIFFRLMLPLAIALATGNAPLAFLAAGIVFGLVHFYQGWLGVAATTVVGLVFAALYLATGSLWAPIVLHSLMNLNTLWLRPWFSARRSR